MTEAENEPLRIKEDQVSEDQQLETFYEVTEQESIILKDITFDQDFDFDEKFY